MIEELIEFIGDDPSREGLLDTPKRVLKAWKEMCGGYSLSDAQLKELLHKNFSEINGYDQIIVVKDISFISFCEHHMLPFQGTVHFGYIPKDVVVGLSKIPRIIRALASRLQIQERFTEQISSIFNDTVHPLGCTVIVQAQHLCTTHRGVKAEGATMITSSLKGLFLEKPSVKDEFINLLKL